MLVPGNLKEHYSIILEEGINITGLFRDLSMPLKERLLRKFAAPVLKFLPTKWRYRITDIAKRLRNPSREPRISYPLDFEENRTIASGLEGKGLAPWWGKKAVLCLSHDVDNDEGYRFAGAMADMDEEAGVPSTFNFLTHDNYSVDTAFLAKLQERGFEIGLHGHTHDQGFALRSPSLMKKRMGDALRRLHGVTVTGMRSPALSKSDRYFRVLGEFGIVYDSSLQIGSGIYRSVRIPYPYYFEEYGIWELPLMIQDDNYLRDAVTSEEWMLSSLARFIQETAKLNGIIVLNMHPHLMHSRRELYQKVLRLIADHGDSIAFKTTMDACEYVRKSSEEQ